MSLIFKRGDKLRAADLQSLADAVRANRVLPGAGIRITGSPNGTTVAVAGAPGKGLILQQCKPFELRVLEVDGDKMIRLYPSTLAGATAIDLGFKDDDNASPYYFPPETSQVFGKITIDETNGEITERSIVAASAMPANTSSVFCVSIGYIASGTDTAAPSCGNNRYGPINATICRNWYATAAPYYGVSFA